jgi:hypothetical protein
MATTPRTTTPDPAPDTPAPGADDFKREQEKGGKDPVDPPVEPVKAEPVTVGPQEPYPSGNPPPDPFYRKPEQTP